MTERKILVIEDDADVRRGYHVLLRANGYRTCFAADSLSAMSETRKQQPDLILLDLGIPAGDGFVVLDRLRSITQLSQIPVIVVSGRDLHGNKERALKAGARAFVQKPWNDSHLLGLIRDLLGDAQGQAPQITEPVPLGTTAT